MQLTDIRDALLTIGVPTHHFRADKQSAAYIVWAETGQVGMEYADNRAQYQVLEIAVDYFSQTEYDEKFTAIQDLFNNLGSTVTWRLDFIRYEDALYEEGKQHIHYAWTLQAVIWQDKRLRQYYGED